MGLNSQTLADTRVYAQDTQPTDERDGIIWVDTSVSPRDTFVFSSASNSWENISPSNVHQQDTEPTNPKNGDLWVDTNRSRRFISVWDASIPQWHPVTRRNSSEVQSAMSSHTSDANAHHAPPTTTQNALSTTGYELPVTHVNSGGLSSGVPADSYDANTTTYAALASGSNGFIDYDVGGIADGIRVNSGGGATIDIINLGDNSVLESWNHNGNGWESRIFRTTNANIRLQVNDTTNFRANEVEFNVENPHSHSI